MPKHTKSKAACTCFNEIYDIEANPMGSATNCSLYCPKDVCHYIAHFPCVAYGPQRERVAEPCLVNKKDCVNAEAAGLPETWSSRWRGGRVDPFLDIPVIRVSQCHAAPNISCRLCPDLECLVLHVRYVSDCVQVGGVTSCYAAENFDVVLYKRGNCIYDGCYSFSLSDTDHECRESDPFAGDQWAFRLIRGDGYWLLSWGIVYNPGEGSGCVVDASHFPPFNDYQAFDPLDCDGPTEVKLGYYPALDGNPAHPHYDEVLYKCGLVGTLEPSECPTPPSPATVNSACCHWGDNDLYWTDPLIVPDNCIDEGEGTGSGSADAECFIKWRLTRTSTTTGTYVGTTRTGLTITYTSDNFKCPEDTEDSRRSDFKLTDPIPEGIYGLPCTLCIEALPTVLDESECPENAGTGSTGTAEAVQECDGCLDYGCGLPLYISVCDQPAERVSMAWMGALPCGIDDPGGNCGYFIGTYSCPSGTTLAFLAYNKGGGPTDWEIKVYCLIDDCYVLQDTFTGPFECRCAGLYFDITFTLDEACDCCSDFCCPCTETGPLLDITVTGAPGCAESHFQSLNSSGENGVCNFTLDGATDPTTLCTLQGVITCDGDNGLTPGGIVILEPLGSSYTLGDSGPIIQTVNSCDPIDIVWTDGLVTVHFVEVP